MSSQKSKMKNSKSKGKNDKDLDNIMQFILHDNVAMPKCLKKKSVKKAKKVTFKKMNNDTLKATIEYKKMYRVKNKKHLKQKLMHDYMFSDAYVTSLINYHRMSY